MPAHKKPAGEKCSHQHTVWMTQQEEAFINSKPRGFIRSLITLALKLETEPTVAYGEHYTHILYLCPCGDCRFVGDTRVELRKHLSKEHNFFFMDRSLEEEVNKDGDQPD